ncbi:hypothetical protein FB451DRAFT_1258708, partial [Mycena latifolia]
MHEINSSELDSEDYVGTRVKPNKSSLLLPSPGDSDLLEPQDMSLVQNQKRKQIVLQLICGTLHLGLILMHTILLIVGIPHWEHRLVFPVQNQKTVSFCATALTTTIGTVYGSILVFLTQKLALQHNFRMDQTLTAAHDSITSWAGLGSAVATLYNQITVPASVLGTLNIFGYLACISFLHIITPTILSVQTFNGTSPVTVGTYWLPKFDIVNPNATRDFMTVFPSQFLPWIGNLDSSQTLGLFNGSLYEVLDDGDFGNGEAPVSVLGFNITCGYLPAAINASTIEGLDMVSLDLGPFGAVYDVDVTKSQPFTVIQIIANNSIILYTTNDVHDSTGQKAPPLKLNLQQYEGSGIKPMQCLQCSKSLVWQSGTVASPSGKLNVSTLYPSIYKTQSRWRPSPELDFSPQDSTLIGSDVWTFTLTGPSDFVDEDAFSAQFTNIEEYLMGYLDINPLDDDSEGPSILALHEIENALSALVATMFWIGGHIQPERLQLTHTVDTIEGESYDPGAPPELMVGSTILQQEQLFVRLDISWLAVSLTLGASIILIILCAPFLMMPRDFQSPINGSGVLHHIWLSQHYPEQLAFLWHVKQPTEVNLRIHGQQTVQLSNQVPPKTTLNMWPKSSIDNRRNNSEDSVSTPKREDNSSVVHTSTNYLTVLCLTLHLTLVLVHLTLVGISIKQKEHSIVFPINLQDTIIFWTKFIATAVGTIYYSMLLYLTQKLAIHSDLRKYCTITATHDKLSSWTGIGSSLSTLYNQIALPASVLPAFYITGYLLALSVLHVTTPALLSIETFNFTSSMGVGMQGGPQWNDSRHNTTLTYVQYVGEFLPWIRNLNESQTPGLFNGSLYDVSTEFIPGGTADISAVGFNITCGYIPWSSVQVDMDFYTVTLEPTSKNIVVNAPGSNILGLHDPTSFGESDLGLSNSIIGYTTNRLFDSDKNTGFPVIPPKGVDDSKVADLQLFRCSRALVHQSGKLDTETMRIIPSSLHPNLHKNHSKWRMYESVSDNTNNSTTLLEGNSWATILATLPFSGMILNGTHNVLSGDIYLMSQLGVDPLIDIISNQTTSTPTLYLHDVENALGSLLASVFWIAGHIHPSQLRMNFEARQNDTDLDGADGEIIVVHEPSDGPVLATGNMLVDQVSFAARLDLNLLSIFLGLGASVILLILAMTFSAGAGHVKTKLSGMGLLQTIWVFQHHPDLWEICEHAEKATEYDLRVAGLVKVRLLDAKAD